MGVGARLGVMVAKVVGVSSAAGMVGMNVGRVEVEGEVEGGGGWGGEGGLAFLL